MQTNLAERIALVTGASSGLGSQFARVLAANGALVVLAARRVERLKELRAEIESQGGEASVVQMDVTDLESIAGAVNHVEAEVGPIDILVNNSGVSTTQRLTEVTAVDFDFVFNTNTRGAFFVAQEVAKRMIARSKQAQDFRARIINVASVAGLRPVAQIGVYCMSKAAVVHMTRAQALEWGRYGINVNAICPGFFPSKMSRGLLEVIGDDVIAHTPLGRLGGEEDLKGIAVFFAAEASRHVTGQYVAVDGGASL